MIDQSRFIAKASAYHRVWSVGRGAPQKSNDTFLRTLELTMFPHCSTRYTMARQQLDRVRESHKIPYQ